MTDDVEVLVSGRGLLESPRWHGGRLYFSDWSAGEVLALGPDGTTSLVADVDSLPLCTGFLPDGTLLIVDSRRGLVLTADGGTYADLGEPGWNDVAVDPRGFVYVNKAHFGTTVEAGLVAVVTPSRTVRRVAGDLLFPNGMAVGPDGTTLIVADSYRHELVAFTIAGDGSLADRRVFAALGPGTPDGICVDDEGGVWYADVPNQWCQHVDKSGNVTRTIALDRGGFACALGDGTLYAVGAEWLGMDSPQLVAPGSGQVQAIRL